jgi:hypothetical protein
MLTQQQEGMILPYDRPKLTPEKRHANLLRILEEALSIIDELEDFDGFD